MSAWPSPRVDRLGTPKAPAIRVTRAMTRGYLVHTFATACQVARPQYGSDHLRANGGFYFQAFNG
jgi:hypothetical protein